MGVDEEDADVNPPPPNLAAMRARASSRRRVCRITYCVSDSPVNRSTPLRSSPGSPGASCMSLLLLLLLLIIFMFEALLILEVLEFLELLLVNALGRWNWVLGMVLSLPNPEYLLLFGFCDAI